MRCKENVVTNHLIQNISSHILNLLIFDKGTADVESRIILRKEAKDLGLKFYFTGKPCKNGMTGLRLVSNGACQCAACGEAKRERDLRYNEENRESRAEKERLRREGNPEAHRESVRLWQKNNSKARQGINRRFYQKNREVILEKNRRYAKENPEKGSLRASKYRAAKRNSSPVWFGEFDQLVIEEAYALAKQRASETSIEWHVDHMIPLQARKACGLHCAENIQVIPAAMNQEKGNKIVLTEPLQWLK